MINKKLNVHIDVNLEEQKWSNYLILLNDKYSLEELVVYTLEGLSLNVKSVEISLILTNDNVIRKYNAKFRDKDSSTNVLSFPAESPVVKQNGFISEYLFLGDILFSFETIKKEALTRNISIIDHFIHLFIHSLLHLLGFNHNSEEEAKIMEKLEVEILHKFGIDSPYE